MSELAKLLVKLRGKESLRDVAERANISHSYLSNLEKGIDPRTKKPLYPSPDTLKQLANAYEYPYEKLLIAAGYIEDKPIELTEVLETKELTLEGKPVDKEELRRALLSIGVAAHTKGELQKGDIDESLLDDLLEVIERAKKSKK